MEILIIVLLIFLLCSVVFVGFSLQKNKGGNTNTLENEKNKLLEEKIRLETSLQNKQEELGTLKSDLKTTAEKRDELSGKNKSMFVEKTNLQNEKKNLEEKIHSLQEQIAKFESEKERKEKEFTQKITKLEEAKTSLENEKIRVQREDEAKLQEEQERRDRIWNEHEIAAIAKMKDVCIQPEIGFSFFENTNLPENFDGKLKPDFLVEFLGQYIIFDAKMSRSANLQNYINDQVKSTAKKIKAAKNSEEIYSTVFFVVPLIAIEELKKISFYEEGFSFYVITPETFESVIAAFKKITNYENLDKIDPQERENIVTLLAAYDQNIAHRNATDILSTLSGLKVSQMKDILTGDMKEEIELKKKKMRIENFKPTDLKRLIQNPAQQIEEIKSLVVPQKTEIEKDDLKNAVEQMQISNE